MNPRFSDLIKTLITIGATMVLADTNLSPDDINTLAGAATILVTFGYAAYERKGEGWRFGRKKFQPGEEVVEGGQTWVCKA